MHWRPLLVAIGVLSVAGSAYLLLPPAPCEAPIAYRIGEVDPRFGLTEDSFKADVERANRIWESSIGRDLFAYDPEGALIVNLIYDERQELTEKEQELSAEISATSEVADSVKRQYALLRAQFNQTEEEYNVRLSAFSTHQAAYNAEVEYWNGKGGAPKGKFEALAKEKDALLAERDALEEKRQAVNQLADEINAYINKYNLLVAHINTTVSAINNDGLAGTEFEEGTFISDKDGTRINIYQFADTTDLIRVLAHEFGHALGLPHNANPDSILSPVNQSDALTVSAEDLEELKKLCSL